MVRYCALIGLALLWGCSEKPDTRPVDDEASAEPREETAIVDASVLDAAPSLDARVQTATDAFIPPSLPPRQDASVASACAVGPVPERVRKDLKLDAFYAKYADANGVAVLGSSAPSDASLVSACRLVTSMLAKRDDVRKALISAKARFAILGKDEGTAAIPEYGYRERTQMERDQINERARGLGGQVASCGEENILCLKGDRYWNESICVHEFAHTISTYGVFRADRTFESRLESSYEAAKSAGILARTYRLENLQEYWAEGVQDWYDTNASSNPPNGVHNQVNTRPELKDFDPTLYGLVEEVFPSELAWEDCHAP
ncbi:MAG TPA: hypothetical protein VI299_06160 [Polyangiales bacterium]